MSGRGLAADRVGDLTDPDLPRALATWFGAASSAQTSLRSERGGRDRRRPGLAILPGVETSPGADRKLAAILAADVVGSSRLMEADEETAVRELHAHRATITGFVESHHGRVFGGAGDSLVAEFASVVGRCVVPSPSRPRSNRETRTCPLSARCSSESGSTWVMLWIIDADDLMGDGVNVAARLEGLAPAGGITVSESIYQQIGKKIEIPFEDAGEYHVKNIERPIRVWRWPALVVLPGQRTPNRSSVGANSPSVAVLPFINMSGDTEQEYFS